MGVADKGEGVVGFTRACAVTLLSAYTHTHTHTLTHPSTE